MKRPNEPKPQSLGDHLDDLRRATFRSILVPFVVVCAIWPFFVEIHYWLLHEILTADQYSKLSSIRALDTFSMSVQYSLYLGIVVSIPWIVWNLWWFIRPGLYPHERRFGSIAIPASMLLFLIGVAFGFYVVIPAALGFLLEFGRGIAPGQIIDVQNLLDLIYALLFILGATFQIPLVVSAAIRFRLFNPDWVTKHRRVVIMISAVLGAVLTPTGDILTMSLVGAPIYFLIEGGVLIGKFWKSRADRRAATEPKSVSEGFRQGMAEAAGRDGLLGTEAAESFGDSLRRLSREFAENVKGGLEEFRKDDQDPTDEDPGEGGAPRPPVPPAPPPRPTGGAAAPATAADPDVPDADRTSSSMPPPASPALGGASSVLAPRAPLNGPSDAALQQAQAGSAAIQVESGGTVPPVPMLPRELRRRIDHYIEQRLREIMLEMSRADAKQADSGGGVQPEGRDQSGDSESRGDRNE